MMNVIGKFLSVTFKIYKTVAVTIIILSRTLSRLRSENLVLYIQFNLVNKNSADIFGRVFFKHNYLPPHNEHHCFVSIFQKAVLQFYIFEPRSKLTHLC